MEVICYLLLQVWVVEPVPVQHLHEEFAGYRERFGIDIEARP